MFSSEAPMARLLAAQARRRGFLKLHIWAGLSLLLCLVPAGAAALTGAGDSMEARTFVYVFAVALAALVPLGQIQGDAALLAGLRRGRCLEDILGTRTQAREIVDQVAGFSLLSVLKMGLAVAVPLLAGLLLVTPPANRALVLGLGLGWFPTAALLVLIGSYVVQASSTWSRHGESGLATALFLGLLLAGGIHLAENHNLLFAALLVAVVVALGLGARWLALRALDRAGLPKPRLRPSVSAWRAPAPTPARGGAQDNPIALREEARRRGNLPFPGLQRLGVVGYLLARHWPVWLGLAVLLACKAGPFADVAQGSAVGLAMIVLFLQPFFASVHTANAVLQEQEGGTLEALVATGLEARTFVDGWARAAWRPRLVEVLLVLAGAGLVLWPSSHPAWSEFPPPAGYLLAHLPEALVRIFFGAYLGLVVSCLAKARRDMWILLVLLWVASQMAMSMTSGLMVGALALLTTFSGIPTPEQALAHGALVMGGYLVLNLLVSIAAVLGLRWLALSQVRTRLAPRR
jgi:hypothetical protein